MTITEFRDRLKALNFIGRHEFCHALDGRVYTDEWLSFRGNPAAWLIRASDQDAEAVLRILEGR